MEELRYTPDDDVKVHTEGAIRLICKAFQSHEDGLPEWLKNSSDAYIRENAPEEKRVIIVIFKNSSNKRSSSISCLDLCGMTAEEIERDFRHWADPEASRRGGDSDSIQGGHGNGGKCYMIQMFENYSYFVTVKNGLGNRYGVPGNSIQFGYIPDRESGRNFPVNDIKVEIENLLLEDGCSMEILPEEFKEALKMATGFTYITGSAPRGYKRHIPVTELIHNLQDHPQMLKTIDICKIFIVVDGELYNNGKPLCLTAIPPMEGAEEPLIIPIPEYCKDPYTNEKVSTTDNGKFPPGQLILRTSQVSMRWKKKLRHRILYIARSGVIGYKPVTELDIQSPYKDKIYGECTLQSLEQYKTNERARLAESPMTRAIERFISIKIQEYAEQFEKSEKQKIAEETKSIISSMNEALDKWKNQFLKEYMGSLFGDREGIQTLKPPSLPSGKPFKIELSLTNSKTGIGVSLKPIVKFYDKDGARIRPTKYRLLSEDNNVAMIDEDLMLINTFTYGNTVIYAETVEGKLKSNSVPLEVLKIHEIKILPDHVELPVGSRFKLEAICKLADGVEVKDVNLVWIEDNPTIARVSSSGMVYAFSPGITEVTAGDDKCIASKSAVIKVIPADGIGSGDKKGRGYPKVLISGIDVDPDTKETVNFSRDDPPVWQRPQDVDRNIWWINSSAPFARLYLGSEFGPQSREWRIYLIERYIEIMAQIILTQSPEKNDSLSVGDWILNWGEKVAEIQSSFAAGLRQFINEGDLPGGE